MSVLHGCYALQRKLQVYAAAGCIKRAIKALNSMRCVSGYPTIHDYNSLIYCNMKSKFVAVDDLLEIYLGMKRFGPSPNAATFNTMMNGLVSSGRVRDAIRIAEDMGEVGFLPSFSMLSKLLKKSFDFGSLEDSFGVFEFMLKLGFVPTQPCLMKLFVALCEEDSKVPSETAASRVLSVLINKEDCFRDSHDFNPILWALCKSNHIDNALAFLCFLKKKGFECDVYSYTALVYGFCRKRSWKEAYECLDKMEAEGHNPNVITYTIVIKSLSDNEKIKESLYLLKVMEEKKGCSPDMVTYNVILWALCKHKRHRFNVGKLFQVIDRKGLTPDKYTYAAIAVGLLKRGRPCVAERLLHQIISSSCCFVDIVIYNIYLNILCSCNKTKEALFALDSMIRTGIKPTIVSYNTILIGICNEKHIHEAMEIFDQIGWPADLVSFNILLAAACEQGDSTVIERILYRMEHEGFELDVVSSTCLILYFSMAQEFTQFLNFLDNFIGNGSQISIRTFNALMSSLCQKRLAERAYTIYTRFRSNGISPDIKTYDILLRGLIKECNYFLVDELLRDMCKQRLKPDILTNRHMRRLCKEVNSSSYDLKLRYHLHENGINRNTIKLDDSLSR
ncbi:hypothetical protein DM860_006878 [Cuscuta australis]|uniref:Pentacotripeptide-repeat region of PRORP domain-containing protein n=1 Tax=Cuscuta australis TaxID=267555 RepID=A0A328E6Y1_9ASTE|nr:hypothetical protein DM860_006878 [Cuscuta australis]